MNNIKTTRGELSEHIRKIIGRRRRRLGALGEALIVKHLTQRGFEHLGSNYRKKQGEIDLIFVRNEIIHFIEVKTVSREIRLKGQNRRSNVNHETFHLPEENVSSSKLRKISKMIRIYLSENNCQDREWQFDVAAVFLDHKKQKAVIKFLKDIPVPM